VDTIIDFGFVKVTAASETASEVCLVEAARRGDRSAFDGLYRKYARMVHGMLLARAPASEVDDLVQDVFLSAYRRIRTLREAGAFGGWLAMITRHRAYDYHRQYREVVELPDDRSPEAVAAQDAPLAEARQVLAILQTLPQAYRETLVLRLVEGLTGPEIAEQTGLTPASVRVNLHRGMKLLREKLERREAHA